MKNRLANLPYDKARIRTAISGDDLSPLDLFLAILRDHTAPIMLRVEAARSAAPYVHKKMPTIIEGGERPLLEVTTEELRGLSRQEITQFKLLLEKMGVENSDAKLN